jgi:hypothetical protein
MDSDASYVLRFCTTSPTGSGSPCDDRTRAKPVAMTWPKPPDALVSLESVSIHWSPKTSDELLRGTGLKLSR